MMVDGRAAALADWFNFCVRLQGCLGKWWNAAVLVL